MEGGMANELYLSHSEELCPDDRLQRRIWEELEWEPDLDTVGVRVEVTDCMARLMGTVRNYPAKLAVERAADRVSGLQNVSNELVVEPEPGDQRADGDLQEAVEQALAASVLVPPAAVRARVADGVITLYGQVAAETQREAAFRIVAQLRGVRGVRDQVAVGWTSGTVDLHARVSRALERDSMLHDRHIRVDVHGGAAVLHGTVKSLAERAEAEEVARRVPGVSRVEDEDLRIRP